MNDLILGKLYLKNFYGIYGVKEYDLSDLQGLIGFIGENGTNKSNTLLALPFIFYGELPEEKLRNFINTTALTENPETCLCEASLSFSVRGTSYFCSRIIKADESMTSKLEIDGKLLSRKRGEVDSKILDILGMPLDIAQLTIFSEQGKVAKFFDLENPEKKQFLDKVINVNYKSHLAVLTKRVSFFEKRQARILSAHGIFTTQKRDIATAIVSHRAKIKTLNDDINKFDESRLNQLLLELESYSKFEKVKLDLAAAEQQLASITQILSETDNRASKAKSDLVTALKQVEDLKFTFKDIAKVAKPNPFDATQMDEKDRLLTEISKQISGLNLRIQSTQVQIKAHEASLQLLSESLISNVCYVCKKPGIDMAEFTKNQVELQNLKKVDESGLQDLNISLIDLNKKSDAHGSELASMKVEKKKYDDSLALFNENSSQRKTYAASLKGYLRNRKILAKTHAKAHTDHLAAIGESNQKHQEHSPTITQLTSNIQAYKNALEASPIKYEDLVKEVADLKQHKIDHDKLVIELTKHETILNKDLTTEVELTNKIEKITRIKDKIQTKLQDFPLLKKHIETNFVLYVQNSLTRINNLTNQILKEIASSIEIKLMLEETAKSSSVVCHYFKDQLEVPKISGGQKVVLGICFRIALWKYLSITNPGSLSFMILDEVLVQLNADSATAAFNQIKALKKYFRYIFMTSHTDHIWNVDHSFKFGK
jgi:DNA repair exonuclease SbcCD ATPase subunit